MARARVSVSLTPHELAIVAECLRVYSETLRRSLAGEVGDCQFNGALCGENWGLMYMWVEEIRSTIGSGEPSGVHAKPPPRQVRAAPARSRARVAAPKKRKTNTMAQAKKTVRIAKKISRWL